jgi:hypothetical protein
MLHQPVAPKNFRFHSFKLQFFVNSESSKPWNWLNNPDTFIKGQLFPYKVEFVSDDNSLTAEFRKGVFNNHHGPLLNLPAIVQEVIPSHYRDMHYLYGSYFISLRLIRPARLQFWVEQQNQKTSITVQLDSYVGPFVEFTWNAFQSLFWRLFALEMKVRFRK